MMRAQNIISLLDKGHRHILEVSDEYDFKVETEEPIFIHRTKSLEQAKQIQAHMRQRDYIENRSLYQIAVNQSSATYAVVINPNKIKKPLEFTVEANFQESKEEFSFDPFKKLEKVPVEIIPEEDHIYASIKETLVGKRNFGNDLVCKFFSGAKCLEELKQAKKGTEKQNESDAALSPLSSSESPDSPDSVTSNTSLTSP